MNSDNQYDHSPLPRSIEEMKIRQAVAREAGVPALRRLVAVASGDTGQCSVIRHFLLGLYNGPKWPFDLTDLRRLDYALLRDVLTVIEMDATGAISTEIHKAVNDGDRLFKEWWFSIRPEDRPKSEQLQ